MLRQTGMYLGLATYLNHHCSKQLEHAAHKNDSMKDCTQRWSASQRKQLSDRRFCKTKRASGIYLGLSASLNLLCRKCPEHAAHMCSRKVLGRWHGEVAFHDICKERYRTQQASQGSMCTRWHHSQVNHLGGKDYTLGHPARRWGNNLQQNSVRLGDLGTREQHTRVNHLRGKA